MKAKMLALVGLAGLVACTTVDVRTQQVCLNPAHSESKSGFARFWDWAFGPACGRSDFYAGFAAYDNADYVSAAKTWQAQADHGLARAQFHLATLYAAGIGVELDSAKAKSLFRAATASGYNGRYYSLMQLEVREGGVGQSPAVLSPARQAWYDTLTYAEAQVRVDVYAAADVTRDLEDSAFVGPNLAAPSLQSGPVATPRPPTPEETPFETAAAIGKSGGPAVVVAVPIARPKLPPAARPVNPILVEQGKQPPAPTLASVSGPPVPAAVRKAAATFNAGMTAYMRGSYRDALRRWIALAEAGDERARTWVGIMHENGQGVPKDYVAAAQWYGLAADQGYADAQFSLALSYDKGLGLPEDAGKAAQWYERAAAQGHIDAQFRLGLMYLNGRGAASDLKLAHVWFSFAAGQGDSIAQESVDLVTLGMTGAELVEAEILARQWQRRITAAQDELAGS